MTRNISFVAKIIAMVSIAFLLAFGSIYYIVFNNYKTVLLEEQSKKINILLNTISPIVAINLEFNILNNIDIAFDQLTSTNKEIVAIKLINIQNDLITKKIVVVDYKNIIVRTKPIKDSITKEVIAYLKISFSNKNYIQAINQFQNMFELIAISFIVFIVLFARLLLYSFKPLANISHKLEAFDPEQIDTLKIKTMSGKDEIAIINNTIVNMIEKIDSHTRTLNDKVKNEIKKNDEKEQFMLHQSRLAQVGEMISMIAHQWRQPLASISSTTSALEVRIMIDDYNSDYFTKQLKNISNYSQYLSTTIEDFRNFFTSNDTQVETTLNDILNDSLKISQASIESKYIAISQNSKSSRLFTTYKNEVQQVILNILKNAEDILLEKNIQNPTIDIKIYENNNQNILEISDNGQGISDNIIDKIFDPYFTTKDKRNGTGLGLYMSKRIIENRCNGKLIVTNQTNGAVFKIVLQQREQNG